MYDWPEISAQTDGFWDRVRMALAARGVAAPTWLARGDHNAPWTDPNLLLAQSCGMPLVTGLCGAAVPVARASYGLPGTGAGSYSSAIVVRRGDTRDLWDIAGGVVAINSWDSQSGRTALAEVARRVGIVRGTSPVFSRALLSGGHRDSARLVAGGKADLAALDAVSWALLQAHEPATAQNLAVLGWSPETPGLPFITAQPGAAAALVAALTTAIGPPAIGLPIDIIPTSLADYGPVAAMVARARQIRLAPEQPWPE